MKERSGPPTPARAEARVSPADRGDAAPRAADSAVSSGRVGGVSAAEARRLLQEAAPPLERRERVPLGAAAGRVLAESLRAPEDVPPAPRAVMDGFAVRAEDVVAAADATPVGLKVLGRVSMGIPFPGRLGPGEAVEIPTGGWLPEGADAVVMVEHTQAVASGRIAILRRLEPGRNVIHAGEDIGRGALVAAAGRRIGGREIAGLALFGVHDVAVYAQPRVAVLSTGSELAGVRDTLKPGQIRDVNQPVLAAAAEGAGCRVTRAGIVADDPGEIGAALGRLLPDHDAVIVSGGSSIGGKDFTAETLAGLCGRPGAELLFHGIDVRPGRPTIAARVDGKLIFGLPGVPTSALVIYEVFVRPVLWRLAGEVGRDPWPARRRARLLRGHASVAGREDYVRVRLEDRDGEPWAEPLPGGSAALSSLLGADGLVIVEAPREGIEAGEEVAVCLFGGL